MSKFDELISRVLTTAKVEVYDGVPLRSALTPKFTWSNVVRDGVSIAHAFAARWSLCGDAALPRNWLTAKKDGAVCLACSRELRSRRTITKLFP